LVAQAQAKISAAQEELGKAQVAYEQAVADKTATDLVVEAKKTILDNATQDKQVKIQAVLNAQKALEAAQLQYETALIPDPLWIHPTYQQEHTRQVAYTEMVPRTITTERYVTRTTGGVTAQIYNRNGYNQAPPLPYAGESPISTQTVSQIDFDWGSSMVLGTREEDVLVKFSGTLVVPETNYYHFYTPADDGTKLYLNNQLLIDDWMDKGGGGSTSQAQYLVAGTAYPFTLYYYENGGGAAVSFQYYTYSAPYYQIVPAAWMGNNTITETIYEQTTVYDEVTLYRDEIYYTTELVPGATAPMVKDPQLLVVLNDKQDSLDAAQAELSTSTQEQQDAQQVYNTSATEQSEKAGIIVVASNDVINKQENVYIAQQELEAIPPFREPTPTPEETTQPTQEPEIPVTPEIPEPVTPTPTEPEQPNATVLEATAQLEERAAENDTGVLPYTVADVVTELQAEQTVAILSDPAALAGAVAEGLAETAQFIGEVFTEPGKALSAVTEAVSKAGLDMSDDQREKAQEVIVPVVIVSQIASVVVGRIK
jgi:hypothetical protein